MKENNWNEQLKNSKKQIGLWTFLWVITMAIATFGPKFIWNNTFVITLLAVVINTLIGVVMILANIKYFRIIDDLQQKIQLEAMGVALGVGVVGGLSYSLLDITNLIGMDAEISFLVMAISLTYLIGLVVGQKKFR